MKNVFILLIFSLVYTHAIAQKVEKDIKLGKENAKKVEETMGIYKNTRMTTYIAAVGERLVSHLDSALFEYHFAIIDEEIPNAFSLPGGYVYVTRGILPLVENEDELAGILGHEIIHSNNRHSIRQMKKAIFPALLQLPGNIVGIFDSQLGATINAPLKAPSDLLIATYGRKFENEADNEGVTLAAKAGYEPMALSDVLIRMSDAIEVITGSKEQKSYFSDHPYTPDRSERISSTSEKLVLKKEEHISKDFLSEFEGLIFGPDPAKGYIKDNIFLHPVLGFYIGFPEKWKIENTNSAVGAYNEKDKSMIVLMPEDSGLTAKQAAEKFVSKLSPTYKSQISESKAFVHNGEKAYLLRFDESSPKYKNRASVYWIPMNGKLYRVIGISPYANYKTLDKSILSFRKIKDEEINLIKESYLHIVKAKEGETLKELCRRSDNTVKTELIAIINNHKVDDKLKEGEEIKVVLQKAYEGPVGEQE